MSKTDFSALDDAICEVIHADSVHPTNASRLQTIVVNDFAPKGNWWRLVGRRLQAMRKSGRLLYSNTGRGKRWTVAVAQPAVDEFAGRQNDEVQP